MPALVDKAVIMIGRSRVCTATVTARTTRFDSAQHLKTTLENYRTVYNHHMPQKALQH
ncbi:hypothetical protein THITH_08135 [Thioalkalivibrio paradoxus ARh 1]|uniref:Integrase catalytic domain-containing protein n=1 Tax=Thioalkalivibrio paradoxus ARh 1 TaxID=713585 RepID=W0DNL6_9GAMM|nr:hypothetical protein THITH_08135 [Thioalkalivibrio paradoxus ARh 1]